MKKTTLQSLVAYLNGETVTNLDEIKVELETELNRGAEKAKVNQALYDEMREKVLEVLRGVTAPVTAQELADETGYAKGKIVYGLTHYWTDAVATIEGKTNTYTLKAE